VKRDELDKTDFAVDAVIINSNWFNHRWDHFDEVNDDHRVAVLAEEFGELVLALAEKHDDPKEVELIAIGGIAINWLRHCSPQAVAEAMQIIEERHPGSE
jgi:uncharacterized protein YejL (UPF0352 family)